MQNVYIDVQNVCDDVQAVDDNVYDSQNVYDVQDNESIANVVGQADAQGCRNYWSVTFDVTGHGSSDVEMKLSLEAPKFRDKILSI